MGRKKIFDWGRSWRGIPSGKLIVQPTGFESAYYARKNPRPEGKAMRRVREQEEGEAYQEEELERLLRLQESSEEYPLRLSGDWIPTKMERDAREAADELYHTKNGGEHFLPTANQARERMKIPPISGQSSKEFRPTTRDEYDEAMRRALFVPENVTVPRFSGKRVEATPLDPDGLKKFEAMQAKQKALADAKKQETEEEERFCMRLKAKIRIRWG